MLSSIDIVAIIIVTLCHTVGGIAAFGSALLSVPLLTLWWGPDYLQQAVFLVLFLGLLQAAMLYLQNWRQTPLKRMWPLQLAALTTLPLGIAAVHHLPRIPVILLLSVIIFAAALHKLLRQEPAKGNTAGGNTTGGNKLAICCGLFGGTIHGAFGVGGSLLVIGMQSIVPQREQFRPAMASLWVVLGIAYMALSPPRQTTALASHLTFMLAGVGVIVATLVGNKIAQHVSAQVFSRIVACLLLISGCSLLLAL